MNENLDWIEAVAPDFFKTLTRRYHILQQILWMEPVGRRMLASELDMSERTLRTESDILKSSGVITTSKSGMKLTKKGRELLAQLEFVVSNVLDISEDERALGNLLGIQRVIIVPGDLDLRLRVVESLGRVLNETLVSTLPNGPVTISVTGGNTMAEIAEELTPVISKKRDLTFVPARGGVGEAVEIQANTISAKMAEHTNGKHKALYVPEDISEKSFESLLAEPSISSVIRLIERSDVVLHSIGKADVMAKRRDLPAEAQQLLERKEAVSEAFGDFFDAKGNLVYKIPRIGLHIRDLDKIKYVFAIVGGSSKAQAIQAYMKNAPSQTVLITDEGASNAILRDNPLK
ncbi:central glycolytic genes regulator [Companilactobacillus sp. RD055328]|uniref:sugar-binding transcriptional regulator n=1 Tax=Companilactobacillus sp. RD055328 TaxID=2916634 RepID=UPI001FC84AF9|nr:sugar-binding domain-containing protein [Companilactobacillus sp. RD055328]GKQ43029.1 central glycolytic genes regulator [Companilactobacillus sp. RD055328]